MTDEVKYQDTDENPSLTGPQFTDGQFEGDSEGLAGDEALPDIFDRFAGLFYKALETRKPALDHFWTCGLLVVPAASSVQLAAPNLNRHKLHISYSAAAIDTVFLAPTNIPAAAVNTGAGVFSPAPVLNAGSLYHYQHTVDSPGEVYIVNTSANPVNVYIRQEFLRG